MPKREIDRAKAADRKREVDEGVKLATRVDNLRGLAAQEEANLEKFRVEKLAAIAVETSAAETKRDLVLGEVEVLEERKKEAQVPLDAAWEVLRGHERALDAKAIEQTATAEAQEATRQEIAIRDTETAVAKQRVIELKGMADADHKKAVEVLGNAHTQANGLKQKAQAKMEEAEELHRQATSRETAVSNREKRADERDAAQDKREQELNKLETKLLDREQSITRNHKKTK